jgi:hypothetical protein
MAIRLILKRKRLILKRRRSRIEISRSFSLAIRLFFKIRRSFLMAIRLILKRKRLILKRRRSRIETIRSISMATRLTFLNHGTAGCFVKATERVRKSFKMGTFSLITAARIA